MSIVTRLCISGYRSLRDVRLELQALTVVTGANGSGKSSLLRLLATLLVPAAGGALLFLKGVGQQFSIDHVLRARIQLTSGRQWERAVRSPDGLPAFNCELKLANFPIALIVSFEMSDHGMIPQFIGLGTSLDVVEDLLGREENTRLRPNQ